MKIRDIVHFLESWAPVSLQESYDNCGLLCGDSNWEVNGVLSTLDCVESIIDEAIDKKCNLIVAHHPIVFSGLKSITGKNYIERTLLKAIKNDIAIYAIHTNLDNIQTGVNQRICDKIGLKNTRILSPKSGLVKLITYGTPKDIQHIQNALFDVGVGKIGEYSECSFSHEGIGTFKPSEKTNPTIGQAGGERENVEENRLEVLVSEHLLNQALQAARKASSYEELAYDIIPLKNINQTVGSGMIGELEPAENTLDFLDRVKTIFNCGSIRYTNICKKEIKKVAVCGGSGSFLLEKAMREKADIFITADFKYHQFFDAENRIIIADIGHFESEQFTKHLLTEKLKENFNNFAVHLSEVNTNPVNYL